MVRLSSPFDPPVLKGIKVHPENPFRFDFILDKGDQDSRHPERSEGSQQEELKIESTKLIKYFLASITIPEKDLWVNLSPYEKNRIIPNSFGMTEMGRDLLAEDYMLKQITASLIYPEDEIGKKFWSRVYAEAQKRYGTTDIPVNTFNKVWIVPEKAIVYENEKSGTAYIVEAKLKVMLEQDYLSMSRHSKIDSSAMPQNDVNALGSQIIREIVIPELTKEINENKNFSQLRQVYNSLVLATWYRKKIKDSILAQVYEDKNKVSGVKYDHSILDRKSLATPQSDIELIYQRYLQAFKKGVYNYIKEDYDLGSQETISRKYFSGGEALMRVPLEEITQLPSQAILKQHAMMDVQVLMDNAQLSKPKTFTKFLLNSALAVMVGILYHQSFRPHSFLVENQAFLMIMAYKSRIRGSSHRTDLAMAARAAPLSGNQDWVDFWSGKINDMNLTVILGSGFKRGLFNGGFRFEGDGFQPGDSTAIGIGVSVEDTEQVWMRRKKEGEIIFERLRNDKIVEREIWIKTDEMKDGKNIWKKKYEFDWERFWKGKINEVDITKKVGPSAVEKGMLPVWFQFEGDGFKPGHVSMGIDGAEEDNEQIWMKRNENDEIIFERRRRGEIVKRSLWVKTDKIINDQHIWENKGDPVLWEFWSGRVDLINLTDIPVIGRQAVTIGMFSRGFQFEGNGYRPGYLAIGGLDLGDEGDQVWMRRNEYGEIIFERKRSDEVIRRAIWVKSEKIQNGKNIWELKGDPYLWEFWSGRTDVLDVTNIAFLTAKKSLFNSAFRFEVNGYQPGKIANGLVTVGNDEKIWMRRNEYGEIIFELRKKKDDQLIRTAVWVKIEKEENGKWECKGDLYLWELWSGRVRYLDITKEIKSYVQRGRFNVGFRFEGNGYQPGVSKSLGLSVGKDHDHIWIHYVDKNKIEFFRRRGEELIQKSVWVKTDKKEDDNNVWVMEETIEAAHINQEEVLLGMKKSLETVDRNDDNPNPLRLLEGILIRCIKKMEDIRRSLIEAGSIWKVDGFPKRNGVDGLEILVRLENEQGEIKVVPFMGMEGFFELKEHEVELSKVGQDILKKEEYLPTVGANQGIAVKPDLFSRLRNNVLLINRNTMVMWKVMEVKVGNRLVSINNFDQPSPVDVEADKINESFRAPTKDEVEEYRRKKFVQMNTPVPAHEVIEPVKAPVEPKENKLIDQYNPWKLENGSKLKDNEGVWTVKNIKKEMFQGEVEDVEVRLVNAAGSERFVSMDELVKTYQLLTAQELESLKPVDENTNPGRLNLKDELRLKDSLDQRRWKVIGFPLKRDEGKQLVKIILIRSGSDERLITINQLEDYEKVSAESPVETPPRQMKREPATKPKEPGVMTQKSVPPETVISDLVSQDNITVQEKKEPEEKDDKNVLESKNQESDDFEVGDKIQIKGMSTVWKITRIENGNVYFECTMMHDYRSISDFRNEFILVSRDSDRAMMGQDLSWENDMGKKLEGEFKDELKSYGFVFNEGRISWNHKSNHQSWQPQTQWLPQEGELDIKPFEQLPSINIEGMIPLDHSSRHPVFLGIAHIAGHRRPVVIKRYTDQGVKPEGFYAMEFIPGVIKGLRKISDEENTGELSSEMISKRKKINRHFLYAGIAPPEEFIYTPDGNIIPIDAETVFFQDYKGPLKEPQQAEILEKLGGPKFYGIVKLVDSAMGTKDDERIPNGGVDFSVNKNVLQIQNAGEEIKFHLNPAMLAELQNASGFVPVIINIQPVTNLRVFLTT